MESKRGWLLLVACAVLLSLGCDDSSEDGEETTSTTTIKLGAILDRTVLGKASWTDSVNLATSHMNDALKQAGSEIRFEMITRDSKYDPEIVVSSAKELAGLGVKGLISDVSTATRVMGALNYSDVAADKLNVPIVGVVASAEYLNNPDVAASPAWSEAEVNACKDPEKWIYRTTMNNAVTTKILMKVALEKTDNGDGKSKIGVFCGDGAGVAQSTIDILQEINPDVFPEIIEVGRDVSANDVAWFEVQVAALADDQTDGYFPDALTVLTNPSYEAAITQAYANASITIPMLHGLAFRDSAMLDLGEAAEGHEGVSPILVSPDASGSVFAAELKKVTGIDPNSFDPSAYDAAAVLMLSVLISANGQADPAAITGTQVRDTIAATSTATGEVVRTGVSEFAKAAGLIKEGKAINYEGAAGPCDFDENGNVITYLVHFVVENGAFKELTTYDCITDPATCPQI